MILDRVALISTKLRRSVESLVDIKPAEWYAHVAALLGVDVQEIRPSEPEPEGAAA